MNRSSLTDRSRLRRGACSRSRPGTGPGPAGPTDGAASAARSRRIRPGRVVAPLLALMLGVPAGSTPLLSEVFYDAPGSDDGQGFVEIAGAPGASLEGLVVEGINGSGGSVTDSLALSGAIPADGLFVLADALSSGGTLVADADLLADFDFQNGPDSVVLRGPAGVLDALGYGSFAAGDVFAGEGAPAPDADAGESLARRFADVDTDDNAADFVVAAIPTPGSAPRSVPEPASGAGGAALALALVLGRARRHAGAGGASVGAGDGR